MSAFEKHAAQRVLDLAFAAGVAVPPSLVSAVCGLGGGGSYAARAWAAANPDAPVTGCCWGELQGGAEDCGCWVPEYDVEQADPRPPASPADLEVQPRMCGDCAYRPGSPERDDSWMEDALMDAARGATTPFWCHDGIRRPVRWRHPDGRVIDGDPADYQPAQVNGVPYRADGRPALICGGWAAIAAQSTTRNEEHLPCP